MKLLCTIKIAQNTIKSATYTPLGYRSRFNSNKSRITVDLLVDVNILNNMYNSLFGAKRSS